MTPGVVSEAGGVRRRAVRRVAAVLVLALCGVAASGATFDDVEIVLDNETEAGTLHGYAEYAFEVTNNSATDPHEVRLSLPDSARGQGDHIGRITRGTTVAPGATVRVALLQPPLAADGRGVAVEIDGRRQRSDPSLNIAVGHMQYWYGSYAYGTSGGQDIRILLSRSMNRSDVVRSFEARTGMSTASGSYSPNEPDFVQSSSEIAAWSDQWLAYSRFDGVIVTGDDWNRMTPEVRSALRAYAETGGNLILVGEFTPPADWGAEAVSQTARPGTGTREHRLGFGGVFVVPEGDVDRWTRQDWRLLRLAAQSTRAPYSAMRDVNVANRMFPVVEDIGVPVRGLFLLILVFAVLIGPVNLVVLSRTKHRIWLLWTVPAISLLFCGAILAYNQLSEGWTAHSRTQLITLLDQPNRRAATLGWTAYYAPIAPGGGFHFPTDTELTPQIDRTGSGGRRRTIDWTHDQHLASGWIASRIPAHFMVRRAHVERQRVEFHRDADGVWSATNGLEVGIERLIFADPDGRLHRVNALAAGERSRMEPDVVEVGRPRQAAPDRRSVYQSDWLEQVRREEHHPFGPGQYVAVTDRAAFLSPGIESQVRAGPSVIYGVTEHAKR